MKKLLILLSEAMYGSTETIAAILIRNGLHPATEDITDLMYRMRAYGLERCLACRRWWFARELRDGCGMRTDCPYCVAACPRETRKGASIVQVH